MVMTAKEFLDSKGWHYGPAETWILLLMVEYATYRLAQKAAECDCVGGCGLDSGLGTPAGKCSRAPAESEAIGLCARCGLSGGYGFHDIRRSNSHHFENQPIKPALVGLAQCSTCHREHCECMAERIAQDMLVKHGFSGNTVPVWKTNAAIVRAVKEALANFPRISQSQTVSGGVEGANEGITADEKGDSREPEKLNNAQDEKCFICGEWPSPVAGDPMKWPVRFPYANGNGKLRTYCTKCVVLALAESSLSSPRPLSTNVMVHPVQCVSCSEIQDSLQARHNRCYRCGEPLPECPAASPELLPTQLPKEK